MVAKIENEKQLVDLIGAGVRELKGSFRAEEKNKSTKLITEIDGRTRQFSLGHLYEFSKAGSCTDIFKRLFGQNKTEWPSCLPGSQRKKAAITVAQPAKAEILVPAAKPRPPRHVIQAEMEKRGQPVSRFKEFIAAAYT